MSRFDQFNAMPATPGVSVKAKVKWFNTTKGFGFVAPADGTPDAFLHASVVARAGRESLNPDAELVCEIAPGQKGPQVVRIVEVLSEGAPGGGGFGDRDGGFAPRAREDRFGGGDRFGGRDRGGDRFGGNDRGGDRFAGDRFGGNDRPAPRRFDDAPQNTGPTVDVDGTVKWFKTDKGFGFVSGNDGGQDIFVHKSTLRRMGLPDLQEGAKVKMKVADSPKGREAVWVAIL